MKRLNDIHMRDPFVVPSPEHHRYYLFGTTDADPWTGPGTGFDVYVGRDLDLWEGPYPAFRPPPGFWGITNYWAPEVHHYRDAFYMFASFKAPDHARATQVLRAAAVEGPYRIHSPGPVTPRGWECLDGTLHVDQSLQPWMVFCHEWVQVGDGEICAVRLSDDLRYPVGDPVTLFTAGSAPWTSAIRRSNLDPGRSNFVTDGPFLHTLSGGAIAMLWSSFSASGYAMGVARSESGLVIGPWVHDDAPVIDTDAGHGMMFQSFDGTNMIAVHTPNATPDERPVFIPVSVDQETVRRRDV